MCVWGGGAFILQRYGALFSAQWPPCTLTPSVNGHLCVKNSTLVLFYHQCLLEVQHWASWTLPGPGPPGSAPVRTAQL